MAEMHPVQWSRKNEKQKSFLTSDVTLRAYEVYSRLYGKQEAMVTGGCRGGFGVGELIAFLYAHTFPEEEWRARVEEALEGMQNFS